MIVLHEVCVFCRSEMLKSMSARSNEDLMIPADISPVETRKCISHGNCFC